MGGAVAGLAPSADVKSSAEMVEPTAAPTGGVLALLRRLYDKAYLYPCF